MARQPFEAEFTTFVKGLITEASPLTFPENASLEEVNFVLNPDGSRQRRFGMEFEEDYLAVELGIDLTDTNTAISAHAWKNVDNVGDLDILILQVGNDLYFFDGNAASISKAQLNQGQKVTVQGSTQAKISGAPLYGMFVFTANTREFHVLEYDRFTDTVTLTTDELRIRDLFGVDDGLEIDLRPPSLTVQHKYNLMNQGWRTSMRIASADTNSVSVGDPMAACNTRIGGYPSNSDVVWAGKVSTAKEPNVVNSFSPEDLDKVTFGSTRAPLGKHIIDVFDRGQYRRDLMGDDTLPLDKTTGSISNITTYNGRVFYSIRVNQEEELDDKSPNIGTMIFYSKVVDNKSDMGKCFTEADPSAEHVSDVIATDGGFVTIPDAGEVKSLQVMGQSLFVFCTNGIWEVHGGEEAFSATNNQLDKTTDIGVSSGDSVVYAENVIYYWGTSGIYMVARNDLTLRGSVQDLSAVTIRKFYEEIDLFSKEGSVGTFDPFNRTIRWLYRRNPLPNPHFYDRELVYNMNLQAFYLNKIDVSSYDFPFVSGYINLRSVLFSNEISEVVVGQDDVLVITDEVISDVRIPAESNRGSVKYLTLFKQGGTHKFTASYYRQLDFRDWKLYDGVGVDAPAHMLTGYITGGSAASNKEINYLYLYFSRTEQGFEEDGENGLKVIDPSRCKVQVQWDWVNNKDRGRWGREFQGYRLPRTYFPQSNSDPMDYGFTTVVTKNRLRGRGKALSILFKSEPYSNLHIYGWTITGSAGVE